MVKNRLGARLGFTLIELLVVIAIIAILAAILFPVFAQAREKARAITCISNEKQLALATLMYVEDYDEYWPLGYWSGPVTGGGDIPLGWAALVYPYTNNVGILTCPDDTGSMSYALNANFVDPNWSGNFSPRNLASMEGPSSTVMYCEAAGSPPYGTIIQGWYPWTQADIETGYDLSSPATWGDDVWGLSNNLGGGNYCGDGLATGALLNYPPNYTTAVADQCPGATGLQYVPARHSGGSNYVLGDGHAKWYMGSEVSAGFANDTNDFGTTNAAAQASCLYAIDNPGGSAGAVPVEDLGNTALLAPACGNPAITFNLF